MAAFDTRSPITLVLLALGGIWILYRLALYVAAIRRRHIIIRDNGCKPYKKYPHKDPIFGLDLFFENAKRSKEGGFLDRAIERFTHLNTYTYSQLLLGDEIIQTAEPENAKAVLATQSKDFALPKRRKTIIKPLFGHGIFTSDGMEWEQSRARLRPNFVRSQVGDLATFEIHVSHLLAKIPRDGSTIDLQPLFLMLTMDSATDFLFGQSTDVLLDGESGVRGEQFSVAFNYATELIGLTFRLGKLINILPNKKYTDSVKFVHEYVGNYVQKGVELQKINSTNEKKPEAGQKYVFLEELARTGFDAKGIQGELLNILLAGRDTTAGLLAYTFKILARRPDIFDKLRAEVLSLDSGIPTFEQLKSLKYLQYTLNEVLRLHPIVTSSSRTAVRDTTLPRGGGPDGKSPILVKAGQSISIHTHVVHKRKDLYGEDALEFKPERWQTLRPGWSYFPFNGGPRICIGQQFALTEASYTIVRFLQTFKSLESRDVDMGPVTEKFHLTNAPRGGVSVSLTPA